MSSNDKFPDWTEWMQDPSKRGEPEASLSRPVDKAKSGAEAIQHQLGEVVRKSVGHNHPNSPISMRQPTAAEQEMFLKQLFPGLASSTEELKKSEAHWGGTIKDWFAEVIKPVEKQDSVVIGRGPIHLETPTDEEERLRRIGAAIDADIEGQ